MEREKIIELANAEGIYIGRDSDTVVCSLSQLERFARLVEQETLERAAKHFDRHKYQDVLTDIAAIEIRNLKETHDKE